MALLDIRSHVYLPYSVCHTDVLPLATGQSDNDTDFITALTSLFKDIAMAVEENHDLLANGFGASFMVDFTLGLQHECDVQVCILCT